MDAHAQPRSAAPLTHAETRNIIWGMLLPVFMSSLDQTILASALPTIGRDLGYVHSLPRLVTACLIASTAVTHDRGSAPSFVSAQRFDRATRLLTMSPTIATRNPAIRPNRSPIV